MKSVDKIGTIIIASMLQCIMVGVLLTGIVVESHPSFWIILIIIGSSLCWNIITICKFLDDIKEKL